MLWCASEFKGRIAVSRLSRCTSLVAVSVVAAAAAAAPGSEMAALCWQEGTPFTFELCCRIYQEGVRGHPQCWNSELTHSTCCVPEVQARIEAGFQRIRAGAYLEASNVFFDLFNYVREDDVSALKAVWAGFQKATQEFRDHLNREPHSLSYFEVLFHGLGLNCTEQFVPGSGPRPTSADPYLQWARCCAATGVFGNKACNSLFEMMAHALGRGGRLRGASEPESGAYYGNMSELWAFHHFTPSVLGSSDATEPHGEQLRRAYDVDAELAGSLKAVGEPSLGILWAEYVDYTSTKFMDGVYYLTLLLDTMRRAGAAEEVDLVEVGAGFGSMPRLLAQARPRMRDLAGGGVSVRSYTLFDVRSVIDLQRWCLGRTAGDSVLQRDWADAGLEAAMDAAGWGRAGSARALWPEVLAAGPPAERLPPLRVDFVDPDARDLFAHLYAEAHGEEVEAGAAATGGAARRPSRALIAVNSWHEFVMADYLWYYNTLVASPLWRMGVDWILYVSNREGRVRHLLHAASLGRAAGRFSRCMGTPGARGALGKPAAGS